MGLRGLNRPLDRGAMTGDHDLAATIVVGGFDHLAGGDFGANCAGGFEIRAQKRGHGTLAGGNSLLHRFAAQPQQARRLRQFQAAGRRKRAVFAQGMAGHERRTALQNHAALVLQHPQHRHGDGHQRGLGVVGEGQFLRRALEHQLGQLLLQRLVNLAEDLAGGGERGGQVAAHPDGLAALAGENERMDGHNTNNPGNAWRRGISRPPRMLSNQVMCRVG